MKKEDHLFSSSCLYTESLAAAAAAAAVAAAAAAGVKQEDHASGSYVKLEPEQPHDVHLYHSALYAEQSARTCWTSTAAAAAAVAAAPVYAASGTGQHHQGYVDFGRSELDHYSALQKLSCSFPPPPPPPPPTDCGSSSASRSATGQQTQQGPCLQQTSTSANSTSSSGYRMMNPTAAAAAAAAAVAAMSTPLYAMSSLGYSEWSTGASSASSGVGGGVNAGGGRTSSSTSTPLSKGEWHQSLLAGHIFRFFFLRKKGFVWRVVLMGLISLKDEHSKGAAVNIQQASSEGFGVQGLCLYAKQSVLSTRRWLLG